MALAVFVGHALALTPASNSLLSRIGLGNVAVMSFFVLSGFIISEAGSTFYRGRPIAFLVNRFWRIAPPYWLALLVSIAAHYALSEAGILRFPDYPSPPQHIFALDNLAANAFTIFPLLGRTGLVTAQEFYGFVRFSWAIMVEVIFYLAACISFAMAALVPRWRIHIYAAVVSIALILHVLNEYVVSFFPALSFAPYFLLGACLYATASGARFAWAGAYVAYAAASLHFFRYVQGRVGLASAFAGNVSSPQLVATALMILMPILIFGLSKVRMTARSHRTDSLLGDLSYPIYVNHYAVLVFVASVLPRQSWGAMSASIVGTLLLSFLAARIVEEPLKAIRDRIRGETL